MGMDKHEADRRSYHPPMPADIDTEFYKRYAAMEGQVSFLNEIISQQYKRINQLEAELAETCPNYR